MTRPIHQKVTASHLRRDAYLYVRQSTVRQVFENTESTRRQYALRERAVALGWPIERVNVIDSDLGKSGAWAGRWSFGAEVRTQDEGADLRPLQGGGASLLYLGVALPSRLSASKTAVLSPLPPRPR